MPRKAKLLNVKKYLEWVQESCDDILKRDSNQKKYPNGTRLAPIDRENLARLEFFARAILRKHLEKKTRKDIYVES